MPTYIYPNSIDVSIDAMDQYYQKHNRSFFNDSSEFCSLADVQCHVLDLPLTSDIHDWNITCLNNSFTATSCCSLHNNAFLKNSSHEGENDWREFLIDLTDGTVSEKRKQMKSFDYSLFLGLSNSHSTVHWLLSKFN